MNIFNWFRKRKSTGLIPQRKDKRDFEYKPSGSIVGDGVDLRDKFPVVTDQNGFNSCTAHAVCALMDYYLMYKKKFPWAEVFNNSEAYLWYYSRLREGKQDKNDGVILRNVFKTISDKGFLPQDLWDYNDGIYTEPDDRCKIGADMFRLYLKQLPSYYGISDGDVLSVQNALSNGYPVVFGFPVDDVFMYLKKDNAVVTKTKGGTFGFHAMIIVGYNSLGFIVRNSWGNSWGIEGCCVIGYDVFRAESFDLWTLM